MAINTSGFLTESDDSHKDLIAFPHLFQHQVELNPDRLAIVQDDRELTYHDLNELSNRYTCELIAQGIGKGCYVGLCLDRSPEAIAAMLGVFACGAAFVPLDPEYPVDRLAYMVIDASISIVITQPDYRTRLQSRLAKSSEATNHPLIWIAEPPAPALIKPPTIEIAPNDMAYVMYTSGSTGQPKGVQIEHAALATYCFADIDAYQVVPGDRTLQFSTLNFDIAIEEIFPPLLTGGTIVVRPLRRSNHHNELSDIVDKHRVTAIHLATAYWHEWVDLMVATGNRIPASIRLMIVTGETVSVEHYRRWQTICDHKVLWCNAYGPTEATVSATVFIPDDAFDAPNMPIGKPLKRYEAYILNDKLQEICNGETGQLFIGGPALARGYLNRPDLTEEAFINVKLADGQLRRLYRTGDRARWLPNHDIDFCGRTDHQIKLGSYRIEPGEIEATLEQHSSVVESLVSYAAINDKKFLIAYVTTSKKDSTAADLANFLRDRLPAYMIPSRYVFLDVFPKTINGKIDRNALPNPSTSVVARDTSYISPRNKLETQLTEIFQDVLNVPEIGVDDDFFLLGGSSLLVTQVITRLSGQLEIELPVRDFFANPTVATVAKHIHQLLHSDENNEDDAHIIALRSRLPIIHTDYFQSGEHRLFSVRYQPQTESRNHAVLICPAYGHEYSRAYRNLQQFAVQLSQAGFDVMRFDYSSTGNSEGDCQLATADRFRKNIADAVEFLRQNVNHDHVSILGIRLGATLAALCNTEYIDKLVLWDPIVDGSQFLQLLERLHDNALNSLTRFTCQRKPSNIDQLYGHQMSQEKRNSFVNLQLQNHTPSDSQTIITSAGYQNTEPGMQDLCRDWTIQQTCDQIQWQDVQFTESAFSSPNIYRAMLKFLC